MIRDQQEETHVLVAVAYTVVYQNVEAPRTTETWTQQILHYSHFQINKKKPAVYKSWCNEILKFRRKGGKDELWVLICTVHLTLCSYHVTYAFQNESRLYRYLDVKELLARNRALRTKWLWFEFCCSHLNFRYCACFEQGVSWHSGIYRMWVHSETRTWHDKNT